MNLVRPVYAGEIQGASLGAKVEAFNPSGGSTVGEVGELVISEPMPSMPIKFWNDPAGRGYRASYFEVYPGIWRHGDWIKFNERGGCVIYGRSDSTINRKGIRMGTSEIYACVEALDEVLDSLVVDLELLDRDSYMPLFVILREGMALDDGLIKAINHKLRIELSPRHVPDEIFHVREIPYKTVSFLRSAWERLPDAPRPTRRRERRIRHSTRSVERGGTRRGVTAYFEFHAKIRNEMRINADKLR